MKLNTSAGDSFNEVAQKAKSISVRTKQIVNFDFNGINCIVSEKIDLDLLYRDYSNSFIMDWKQVGPDCLIEYEPEVFKELTLRKDANEKKRQSEEKEYRIKEEKAREAFSKKVSGIRIELFDSETYNSWKSKNTDPYGACCFEYAEGWAKLMQKEISNGNKIEDVAEKTSFELNFLGITGFMYGMAVNILSKCWVHGEQLREWHNKEYNHTGDGVVNPAVLTIN